MATLQAFLPLILFLLAAIVLLFVTAANRHVQIIQLKSTAGNIAAWRHTWREEFRGLFTIKRVIIALVVFYLIGYIWVYQVLQDKVTALLVAEEIDGVTVGSLVMPYTAFFRSEYIADTGFSRSRKRTRADVSVTGHLWSGLDLHISETEMVKVNKIVGKSFVFSYLTDVKVLKPAINRYMKQLKRNKQIDEFEIETFDNRGPYILVVLNEKNRSKDVKEVANGIAESLYTNLTQANQLKVNQVIVKVIDHEAYATSKRVKVIGRGKAGTY